jgi:hypothetical protein
MDVNMLTLTLDPNVQQAVVEEKNVPGCSADCVLTLLPLPHPLCPAMPHGLCSGLAKMSNQELLT